MPDTTLPAQGELLAIETLDDGFWRPEESEGRYTAKRFFLKRADDYKLCIQLLAAGAGLLKIARILKIHHRTVAAVRDSESEEIDIAKERIRRNMRLAVEIGSERMPEVLAKIPDAQLPVALGIAIDKLSQLDGEPTQRIEHLHRGHLTHEAVKAALEEFPEAEDADFSETTGLREGEVRQKALPAPPPALVCPPARVNEPVHI